MTVDRRRSLCIERYIGLLLMIVSSSAAAQNANPVEAQIHEIRPEDYCNLFRPLPGRVTCPASGSGDWAPIFEAAMDDPLCSPTAGTGNSLRIGCRLELQCNFDYQFSRPLDVCRAIHLQGCGAGQSWGSTMLSFDAGVEGVRTWGTGGCPRNPALHNGGSVRITDVLIFSDGGQERDTLALDVNTRTNVEDVVIYNFGRGIHARAASPVNANLSSFLRVQLRQLGSWGVYLEGADVNAHSTNLLDVQSVCRQAPKWQQYEDTHPQRTDPPCWGIRDRSFLNGTHVAPHVADVRDIGLVSTTFTGVAVSGTDVKFQGLPIGHPITRGFAICSTGSTGTGWDSTSDFPCPLPTPGWDLGNRLVVTDVTADSVTVTAYSGNGATDAGATGTLELPTAWYPSYIAGESASQSVLFAGAYEEDSPVLSGGARSELRGNAMILGGNVNNVLALKAASWQGRIQRGQWSFRNSLGNVITDFEIGEHAGGWWTRYSQDDTNAVWGLSYETAYNTAKWCTQASPNVCPYRFTTDEVTHYRPANRWWVSRDYILGPAGGPGAQIRVEMGSAPPGDTTDYPVGSRFQVLVPASTSGSVVEYVLLCVNGTVAEGDCRRGTKTWTAVVTVP